MRPLPGGAPRRIAVVSLHTSPLEQPGTGDAGGMNVYIDQAARSLAELGSDVEVFTRAADPDLPPVTEVVPGYRVRQVVAGPIRRVPKRDLTQYVEAFADELLRFHTGRFDALHTHYWLSGQVGWLVAGGWDVPWVHSMHTLARVKNALRAAGEPPEPAERVAGEDEIVAAADVLVANTHAEAHDLGRLYHADPAKVRVVHPGVDLRHFTPGDRAAARARHGLPADKVVLLFVGRLQPLKAPDFLLECVARLAQIDPAAADRIQLVVCGGPSGAAGLHPADLRAAADRLRISRLVRFVAPMPREALADLYRAADVTVVPSYNESFGLVAIESQAVGTPVVAAAVGGLRTAVADGLTGELVEGHDATRWAQVLRRFVLDSDVRRAAGANAERHARLFSWRATASLLQEAYLQSSSATVRVAS